ncbi:MAG: BLUF domain-containing protein [Alphaproteobacteria bacterium]|nr:BLUF domain-containing protein [Alphaproteobacteria bacterium]
MELCRLIYVSKMSKLMEISNFEDVAYSTSAKNYKRGITGILCHENRNFMQLLEGPPRVVNDLYRTILNDERHHSVTLLDYQPILSRAFPEWGMRIVFENFKVPDEYEGACSNSEFPPFPMNTGVALDIIYTHKD